MKAEPKGPRNSAPMLYTRLKGRLWPQRNLMTAASGRDGYGTLAADSQGNMYVTWHAQGQENGKALEGEGRRRVWLARSADDGKTFEVERPVSPAELGAWGCCGIGALADQEGNLYLLYRGACEIVHRDMYLLTSHDRGQTFQPVDLHRWQIGTCPMSTVSLALARNRVLLSWETNKQVYFAPIDVRSRMIGKPRRHPERAVTASIHRLRAMTAEKYCSSGRKAQVGKREDRSLGGASVTLAGRSSKKDHCPPFQPGTLQPRSL